jgi:hypothetical protein
MMEIVVSFPRKVLPNGQYSYRRRVEATIGSKNLHISTGPVRYARKREIDHVLKMVE